MREDDMKLLVRSAKRMVYAQQRMRDWWSEAANDASMRQELWQCLNHAGNELYEILGIIKESEVASTRKHRRGE